MTLQLPDLIDDALEQWKSSRGDKIGLGDISQLIDALTIVAVADMCRAMSAKGMSIDEMNDGLKAIMAVTLKQRTELLREFDGPNKLRSARSFQFGRASAPIAPHTVHTMRGPPDFSALVAAARLLVFWSRFR
jgi:hypothetical protein